MFWFSVRASELEFLCFGCKGFRAFAGLRTFSICKDLGQPPPKKLGLGAAALDLVFRCSRLSKAVAEFRYTTLNPPGTYYIGP